MAASRATKPSWDTGQPAGTGQAADEERPSYTGSIHCVHCRTTAPVTRKFCGSCGASLWQPCHECGTTNAAEEKFCGQCGADLVAGIEGRLARYNKDLETAGRLRQECQFDEALALAEPIAKATHPRFSDQAARASATVRECLTDRESWRGLAKQLEGEASASMENRDFETAIARLESIPAPIRSETVAHLLEEARLRSKEIEVLSVEIGEASGSALSTDLLVKVGRLLELKPNHAVGRRLADRFCERFCKVAERKLTECHYGEVVKVLDRIPQALWTDAVRGVRDKASELALVAWDLQNSPIMDAALVKLALRFRQLAPRDQQLASLCFQILERAKNIAADPWQTPVPWVAAPEPGPLGCSVVWEHAPKRIGLDAKLDAAVLRQNPGSFAVACGLALQGLRKAAIATNLLPDETPLWLRIARWGPKKRPRSAWGIDLGSGSLKAVRLVLDGDQPGGLAIRACDLVEHKKILSQAGDHEQNSLIDETLRTFVDRNDTDADRICVGISTGMLLLHRIEIAPMDPDKLDTAVAFEARAALPAPLDDLAWQYVILNDADSAAEKLDIIVAGVRRGPLADRLARFAGAGLRVDEVQGDCLALHNYVVHNHFAPVEDAENGSVARSPARDDRPLAILDVGADSTNFVVSSPQSVWLRSVGMGVDRVNKALVREFRITFAQAEQWQRDPASAPNVGRVFETLQSVYDEFFQDAASSLQAYAQAHPDRPPSRILGLGGGFRLHGLWRYLRWRR